MGIKIADEKSKQQLQLIFDYLGKFGGVITTDDPGTWWNLDLEVHEIHGKMKPCFIGVFSFINDDVIFDPKFELYLVMDGDKIEEVRIMECEETTMMGTTYVDGDDKLHGFGVIEDDPYGLVERFSNFMKNMTEVGPYLKNPATVEKRECTLAEM